MPGLKYDRSLFNSIPSEFNLEDFLQFKIKLLPYGLFPRFFLLIRDPLLYYILESKEISLLELLHIFFRKLRIGISDKIIDVFLDEFGRSLIFPEIKHFYDLDLFVFYLLTFLFSHLARYRVNTWKNLLMEERLC